MPGFDGTGPAGLGGRTGGGFGFCSPGAGPRPAGSPRGVVYGVGCGGIPRGGGRGRAFGGGRGYVFGGGRGRCGVGFSYGPPRYRAGSVSPAAVASDEKSFLESEMACLEQELRNVRSRLAEIETASAEE